jgi:glycerol dehydrogenase-like iron-containing ADH family enzyme
MPEIENSALKEILDAIAAMDKKLDVHIAQDAHTAQIANENRKTLLGENGNVGLVALVKKNSEAIENMNKLFLILATPVILAIGSGVVWLIAQAVK